jgi:oligopeptide transport system substrate-binding protein
VSEAVPQLAVELDALPHDLRPGRVHDLAGEQIASATGERLFEPARWPASPEPALAVRARAREEHRRWTIELDPDAAWSDGSPVTARDVVRTVEHLIEPRTQAPLAWLGDAIAGCQARRLGGRGAIGCTARGRRRLELTLVRPMANLPGRLATTAFSPLPADTSLVSGPYRIAGRLPGERGFVLGANRHGRAWRSSSPSRIVLLRTDNPEQGLELYERGLLQVTANTWFPHEQLARQRGRPDLHQADIALAAYLLPNPRRVGALGDPRARQAISLSVDRVRAAAAVDGAIVPLRRFTELWGGDGGVLDRDCDAARIAARSMPRPLPGRLRLGYADFPPNRAVAAAIAADVHDALGIELILSSLSYREQRRALASGDFELMYCLSPAPFCDPTSLLAPFAGGSRLGRALGFMDPRFDAALVDAERQSEPEARMRACERANDLLLTALPVVPLARVRSVCLRQPSLGGFAVRPDGTIPFAEIRHSPLRKGAT